MANDELVCPDSQCRADLLARGPGRWMSVLHTGQHDGGISPPAAFELCLERGLRVAYDDGAVPSQCAIGQTNERFLVHEDAVQMFHHRQTQSAPSDRAENVGTREMGPDHARAEV